MPPHQLHVRAISFATTNCTMNAAKLSLFFADLVRWKPNSGTRVRYSITKIPVRILLPISVITIILSAPEISQSWCGQFCVILFGHIMHSQKCAHDQRSRSIDRIFISSKMCKCEMPLFLGHSIFNIVSFIIQKTETKKKMSKKISKHFVGYENSFYAGE